MTLFIIIRHGQSEANAQNLIASTLETAEHNYGLTDYGRNQVRASAAQIQANHLPANQPLKIVVSPLLRTRQTAEVLAQELGYTDEITIDHRFIERGFEYFELQNDSHYNEVWICDNAGASSGKHFNNQVEELARCTKTHTGRLKGATGTIPEPYCYCCVSWRCSIQYYHHPQRPAFK